MNIHEDERLKNMLIKFFNRVFSEKPEIPYSSDKKIEEMFEKKILKYLEYVCEDYDVKFLSDEIDEEDDMIGAIDYLIKCDNMIFSLTIDLTKEINVTLKFNRADEQYIFEEEILDAD
jgi:hypothetical protein